MHSTETPPLSNYLRFHRKRIGLSQQELGTLLGYIGQGQVKRHERSNSLPKFATAIAYEILFQVPIADLFPAARNRAEQEIEERIDALKEVLEQRSGKDRYAAMTARKLEWIALRRGST
jgi:transcriptional regulator with XRE-family HTH domain